MNIDWESKIQIDPEWINRQLINHFIDKSPKITIRGYTPKASGTTFCCNSLVEELGFMLVDYVHNQKSKDRKSKTLKQAYGNKTGNRRLEEALYKDAQQFFGKKDPSTDGKYGELLLFALVESVLKCKMVAHKIVGLSNSKDQVKGGDGVFLGSYEVENNKFEPAIFIGESKIKQKLSECIDEAYESLDRFHSPEIQSEVNSMEFIVANNTMFMDDLDPDFEAIYERLNPNTDTFKSQILVHPVLIMYNTSKIPTIEKQATSNAQLETLIKEFVKKEKDQFAKKIQDKIAAYPRIKRVFVDFFIFPFNNIDLFRNGMYFNIHKVPYSNKVDNAKTQQDI